MHHVLELSQLNWLKPYVKFHAKKKRIEAKKKNGEKDEKHCTK